MINDLVLLSLVGIQPVLVHGGGPEINAWLGKVGIKAEFKGGLRVTDGKAGCGRGTCSAVIGCDGNVKIVLYEDVLYEIVLYEIVLYEECDEQILLGRVLCHLRAGSCSYNAPTHTPTHPHHPLNPHTHPHTHTLTLN